MEVPPSILIVDDDATVRDTFEALLHQHGYRLVFASSGAEALAQAATLQPDVILLDVMMPQMDGFEVCRRLRSDPRTAEVPIIIVTALDDRASRIRGIEAGADDFLSKPVDRVELRARLRTITRLNRYRRLMMERSRFEAVVEQADDGYLRIDADDLICYANPQARRYLSLPQHGPLLDTRFFSTASRQFKATPQEAWAGWPASALANPTTRYLMQPETSGTQPFWLLVETLGLRTQLDGEHMLRLRDVTAQLSVQRDMWTFHGMVNHKLRTPLIGVSGLEILESHSESLDPSEVRSIASIARRSMERLRTTIHDILQYINTSQLARRAGGCAIAGLPELVKGLALQLQLSNVSVISSPAVAQRALVLASEAVELVLYELLENAKKFHPAQQPAVTIYTRPTSATSAAIVVENDGAPLTAEQLQRAWTPYYQGEKSFTGEMQGLGLGLAMVANLIWSVGGTCAIYNRANADGVVIELHIPLAEDAV
jgi:DNA-binding response OmpR family regulator